MILGFTKTVAAALIGLTLAGAAGAQGVGRRHADQQRRIANGVSGGRLTPGKTGRVERQQRWIDRAEA